MQEKTETIVRGVRAMPITEALTALRDGGQHPMADVYVANGRVRQVVVEIGGVRYFFHSTKDRNGKKIGIEAVPYDGEEEGEVFSVPYDGWAARPLDVAPMN